MLNIDYNEFFWVYRSCKSIMPIFINTDKNVHLAVRKAISGVLCFILLFKKLLISLHFNYFGV